MKFHKRNLCKTLFIDIETASLSKDFKSLPSNLKPYWIRKCEILHRNADSELEESDFEKLFEQRAGIYAEFAKVVTISVGVIYSEQNKYHLKLKSFSGSEPELLNSFKELLDTHFNDLDSNYICGHNIKEFDITFLCRRMIINGINLPDLLDISGKKPWQTNHLLDTLEMWKFGDYKHFTSLALLAEILGIPSPKDDINGSEVSKVFYRGEIERIIKYCEKDVATVAQVFLKLIREDQLLECNIEYSK